MQVRSHKIDFANGFPKIFPKICLDLSRCRQVILKSGRISGRFAQTFASVQCTLQPAHCAVASANQRLRSGDPSEDEPRRVLNSSFKAAPCKPPAAPLSINLKQCKTCTQEVLRTVTLLIKGQVHQDNEGGEGGGGKIAKM